MAPDDRGGTDPRTGPGGFPCLSPEEGDATTLKVAYLDVMVQQGFDRAEIQTHIDTPFSLAECPTLW